MKNKFLDLIDTDKIIIQQHNFAVYELNSNIISSNVIFIEILSQIAVKVVKKLCNITNLVIPVKMLNISLPDPTLTPNCVQLVYTATLCLNNLNYTSVNILCERINLNCTIIVMKVEVPCK